MNKVSRVHNISRNIAGKTLWSKTISRMNLYQGKPMMFGTKKFRK